MTYKRKIKQAPWVKAFPKQAKALHPDQTGMKATEADKKSVWHEIRDLVLSVYPYCQACSKIDKEFPVAHLASEVHHVLGRNGLLLFDPRHMISVCAKAHRWIHDHPDEARKLGLYAENGKWNQS